MIFAEITDTNEITVTFNRDFNSSDWISGNFFTLPTVEPNSAMVQTGPRTMELGFLIDVTGETELRNENAQPGLVLNQEIALS